MCKTKIFHELLNIISSEMEIDIADIKNKNIKTTEVVDARSILVYCMKEKGFYPEQISYLLNRSSSNIRKLINDFELRKQNCKMIETYLCRIQHQIESNK